MKNRSFLLYSIFLVFLPVAFFAQNSVFHPFIVKQAVYSDATPPLRSMHIIKPYKGKPEREIFNHIVHELDRTILIVFWKDL